MKYKLLVLDLDGTLTNNRKEITDRTRLSLIEAQKKGVKLVLASGRPMELFLWLKSWKCNGTKVISWPTTEEKSSTGKPGN